MADSAVKNLVWFRSDLRVYDNPALTAAMKNGNTLAVYLITEKQWEEHGISPAKRALILQQLRALSQELKHLNVPLRVISCASFSNAAAALCNLGKTFSIQRMYFNHEYEVNERNCAEDVQLNLAQIGISTMAFHDSCLIEPGKIKTRQDSCYKVFSAFKRAFIQEYSRSARKILNRPCAQQNLDIESDLNALLDAELTIDSQMLSLSLWPAGEDEAHNRLNHFIEERVRHYNTRRDIPGIDGTSGISPYLAVGALSTTQCMQAVLNLDPDSLNPSLESRHPGASTWMNELIWREFYRHLLYHYPELCQFKPFKPETDRLPWRHDKALFQAWANGETGYPIVDAAMKQLVQTGWMHNRLRMITAMFLTKHLFVDWRWGEAFFMAHLIDGDLASNNGGWQWSASTGVDAVPYFRIFNPTRQSQRFDPTGDFIRQYLPALRHLDNKSIHQPNAQQARAVNYPLPIVDHASAVSQTKTWFKQLSSPAAQVTPAQRLNPVHNSSEQEDLFSHQDCDIT